MYQINSNLSRSDFMRQLWSEFYPCSTTLMKNKLLCIAFIKFEGNAIVLNNKKITFWKYKTSKYGERRKNTRVPIKFLKNFPILLT